MRRAAAVLLLLAVVFRGGAPATAGEDPPKIRSVAPATALRGGTVDVALEGTALFPHDEVKCNRGEIGLVVLPLPTANRIVLRLTIPETASAGPVELSVKTKFGVAKSDRFQVRLRSPVVSKVVPASLVRGAEYDVRLEGSNLAFVGQETRLVVDAPMAVKLVGKPTDKLLTLKVTVPPDTPAGPRSIGVETTDGKFAASVTVLLAPPSVTAVTPATVLRGGEVDLTVAGKNLAGASNVMLAVPDDAVSVAPRGAPTPAAVPLRVTVKPGAAPGPRLLVLRTPDGIATASFTVTTPEPRLLGVKPSGVARGAEATLELATEAAPPPFSVRVLPEDPLVVASADASGKVVVRAAKDAGPGPRTLVLDHPFGVATVPFAVNLRGPSVAGISPAELKPGAEADVVVEGTGLEGATLGLLVDDPGVTLTPGPAPGVAHVRVAADAKPGARPVAVRTADGAGVATLVVPGGGGNAPTLTASSSARLVRGRASEVTLSGLNLRASGDQPPTVTAVGPSGAIPVTVVASTASALKVRVDTPAGTPVGPAFLVVRTPEGAAAAAATVVTARPTVATLAPARLVRPGDPKVVVTGADLVGADGAAPTVVLAHPDGSAPIACRVEKAAADRLDVVVPLADATGPGAWVLLVSTAEGGAAAALPVDASPPWVETIDPPTVGVPGHVTFTLRGRALLSPGGKAPAVQVTRLGAAAALKPELLASSAEELSVRVVTPMGTPPGPHVVIVRTADGVAAALFEVVAAPMPTIDALEPAEGTRGQVTTVLVKGTGLLGTTAVTFSGAGVTAELAPGATATQVPLRVRVDAKAEPGLRTVALTAPGGRALGGKLVFVVK